MNDEAVRFEARDLRLFQLLVIALVWQLFRDLPAVALPITLWLLWRAISPWRGEGSLLLRLAETNARDQVWQTVEPSAMPALADFTVGGHWRGYESRLAAGQIYRVRVQRGLFGDVAISPDAFRDAERAAP